MTGPCKDCQRREIGCHGKCTEYVKYREEWDRVKARMKEARDADGAAADAARRLSGRYKWNR